MPLRKGCGSSKYNIPKLIHEGYPQKQAVAIGLSEERRTCSFNSDTKHRQNGRTPSGSDEQEYRRAFHLRNYRGEGKVVQVRGERLLLEEISPGIVAVYADGHVVGRTRTRLHHIGTFVNQGGGKYYFETHITEGRPYLLEISKEIVFYG